MDSLILCGGLGTRISTITQNSFPKAMVKIKEKTILEWELTWLRKYGISHAILAVRHLADYIEEQLGNIYESSFGSIEITYSKEKEKLGSGGAVRFAKEYISNKNVVLMNGDVLTNFNLREMIQNYEKAQNLGSIAVAKMRSPYGIVEFDDNKVIQEFREKPLLEHWLHAGVDIFHRDVLPMFPEKGQMEETVFPELASKRQIDVFQIDPSYYWSSIDTAKDFEEAEKEWNGY